eukprot:TRINITY_DN29508_c3_g1_i1.p1 TRINITY_DN29508_c3_g1~~TRINITY_DN29508_c3_g1_i1.p1  ORF type:complete len:463 (+),score=112.64 TRINITY_DN29508_c3_g1_i1:3-1391(+)
MYQMQAAADHSVDQEVAHRRASMRADASPSVEAGSALADDTPPPPPKFKLPGCGPKPSLKDSGADGEETVSAPVKSSSSKGFSASGARRSFMAAPPGSLEGSATEAPSDPLSSEDRRRKSSFSSVISEIEGARRTLVEAMTFGEEEEVSGAHRRASVLNSTSKDEKGRASLSQWYEQNEGKRDGKGDGRGSFKTGNAEVLPITEGGRMSVLLPPDTLAEKDDPQTIINSLQAALGDAPTVRILGSSTFQGEESEELTKLIAEQFAKVLSPKTVFITSGRTGVEQGFVHHLQESTKELGSNLRVLNLICQGETSSIKLGKAMQVGSATAAERRQILSQIADVYVTIEGGPGTSEEIRLANARGAAVVALQRSGGASAGLFGVPQDVLEQPVGANPDAWRLLADDAAELKASAEAAAQCVHWHLNKVDSSGRPRRMSIRTQRATADAKLAVAEAAKTAAAAVSK